MASVNYVGKSSLVIGIKVISENIKSHIVKHTNTSYFTMVALEDGKPVQVPGLILESKNEVRRFFEAIQRKELKKNYKKAESQIKVADDIEEYMDALKSERCLISNELQLAL